MVHLEQNIGAHGYLGMKMAWIKNIVDELLARIEGGNNYVVKDNNSSPILFIQAIFIPK